MKPRFGLIRAKEFLMMDLYTFDLDLAGARRTYEIVNEQYSKIFSHLNVPYHKIAADTGTMGGKTSHEYHLLAQIGEDAIIKCKGCGKIVNKELCREDGKICDACDVTLLETKMGIEIGHTFILEDKYTKALGATYLSKSGKPEVLQMGCYGIGVTRLIAASIEHLSSENEIRWPEKIAPYRVCIITPKEGSKEEESVRDVPAKLYHYLDENSLLRGDVVIDDRSQFTIGKRLKDAQKLGIPFIIVVGSKASGPDQTLEVFHSTSGLMSELSLEESVAFILNLVTFEEQGEAM